MTTKSETLRNFVLQYLNRFAPSGGWGHNPKFPEFELYAQDYLEFAEQELVALQLPVVQKHDTARLINCVAHLKRAIDCQLDTFLYAYNLYDLFAERNLKFEKKLEFIRAIGVVNSRSLIRLNAIRDKMEHEFEIPKIQDIEIYYDLALMFVAVLQAAIMTSTHSKVELTIWSEQETEGSHDFFCIEYEVETPSIKSSWRVDEMEQTMVCDVSDPDEFAFFLKVLLLLGQLESFASDRYIASQLSSGADQQPTETNPLQ